MLRSLCLRVVHNLVNGQQLAHQLHCEFLYDSPMVREKNMKKNINNLFSREFSHTAEKLPPATFHTINLSAQMKLIFKAFCVVREREMCEGKEE